MKSVLRGVLACVLSMLACILSFCAALPAAASVVITNTRVIYAGSSREVTVQLSNNGQQPVLVSAWIDAGGAKRQTDEAEAPFAVTPPLFRMDPDKGQALRISLTQETLPADRESVFWLNVHEVPPVSQLARDGNNVMQLALRTRIKLFYRPKALAGRVEEAPSQLAWRLLPGANGMTLHVDNPSAYHVSFAGVSLRVGGKSVALVSDAVMVAPGGSHDFSLKALHTPLAGSVKVNFEVINDFGGFSPYAVDVRS